MSRTEEGEFELVLGNRQLLSVFFIVVVLLGVFFVMGYILGKNATNAPGLDVASVRPPATASAAAPMEIDRTTGAAAASGGTAVAKPTPAPVADPEPVREPVREAVREVPRETPKPEPAAKAAPKTETVRPEPVKATPAPAPAAASNAPVKGGLYLQVAAVGRPEAEVVAKVLRGKGHSVIITEVGDGKLHRVLVGPIPKEELGRYRTELTGLGFSPFPKTL
jgi:cell division septation protein DedD